MPLSRVTQQLMSQNFIKDIQRNLISLNDLQRQISTGKRVQYPSDDPIDADRILDYRQTIKQTQQFSKNVDDMNSVGANVDGVLDTVTDLLMRARDLAVRGSNEATETQQNRNAIADELDQIIHELVFQANQKFDGKFLFAGNRTDSVPNNAPFKLDNKLEFIVQAATPAGTAVGTPKFATGDEDPTGNPIKIQKSLVDNSRANITAVNVISATGVITPEANYTIDEYNNEITLNTVALNAGDKIQILYNKDVVVKYLGDSATREVEISEGAKLGVHYAGASVDSNSRSVFGEYSGEPTEFDGVEAFQYLIELRDNLYKYDDVPGGQDAVQANITKGISDVDNILERINNIRADLGGRMNRLELAKNRLENMNINTKALLSAKEDTDMTEAISQLVLQQNVYQAALGVGGRILQVSLLDFLR